MLQLENLFLAVAIVVGAYTWYRAGFRTPRILHLPPHVIRAAVIVFGWTLILGITVRSAAALFGDGRIQVAQSGQMYAHRSQQPLRFWGEIAGDILLVGGAGTILLLLGRKSRPAALNDQGHR